MPYRYITATLCSLIFRFKKMGAEVVAHFHLKAMKLMGNLPMMELLDSYLPKELCFLPKWNV